MLLMTLTYTPTKLAEVLRGWLTQYPEKVLFGSDAAALGPDKGWELAAWIAMKNGRTALALALTDLLRNGEVSRARRRDRNNGDAHECREALQAGAEVSPACRAFSRQA
jgi:hypothetical protein